MIVGAITVVVGVGNGGYGWVFTWTLRRAPASHLYLENESCFRRGANAVGTGLPQKGAWRKVAQEEIRGCTGRTTTPSITTKKHMRCCGNCRGEVKNAESTPRVAATTKHAKRKSDFGNTKFAPMEREQETTKKGTGVRRQRTKQNLCYDEACLSASSFRVFCSFSRKKRRRKGNAQPMGQGEDDGSLQSQGARCCCQVLSPIWHVPCTTIRLTEVALNEIPGTS